VYPTLVRIGTFEITSFGVLVAVGALAGLWLLRRELARAGLPDSAVDVGVYAVFGGLVGAKVLWTIEHAAHGPILDLLLSRGGLSWFGGFAGGVLAGLVVMGRRRLNPIAVLAAATPGLAVGHAIGRIGCFLVGDDYGVPSDLPWAVAFPEGLPPTTVAVHPTQLYEALPLFLFVPLLLRWRAAGVADRAVLGRYLVVTALLRFLIEFWRVNDRVLAGLAVAHLAAIAVAVAGGLLLIRGGHGERRCLVFWR
jgi:phosphatidylglycerol:prolipoprotein diacylglycerol transferase